MLSKMRAWGAPFVLLRAAGGVATNDSADTAFTLQTGEFTSVPDPPFPDRKGAAGEYELPQQSVIVYEDARLVGTDDPVGLTRTGCPIKLVARNNNFDVLRQIRDAGRHLGWSTVGAELVSPELSGLDPDHEFETMVPFTRRRPEINYYHWITEYLPRIRGLGRYAEEFGSFPPVLLEPNPPSWVVESLELAGVPSEHWIEWNSEMAVVRRLVVPWFYRKAFPEPFHPSRSDLAWVRGRFRTAVPAETRSGGNRIFVSRSDADERRIENREEVIEIVRDHGFEVVVPTTLSVGEQVATFREADVVIGPHGAGLTNVLFGANLTIVELFPRDYTPVYYYMLADMFGFDYEYVLGGEASPDFSVSPDAVDDVLSGID